jgi:hypothetical protein
MPPSVLPDSRSSLTKYIWLEDHYKLLRHIKNDTTVHKLKEKFPDEIVATAVKRYLTVSGAAVRRDKLIDLIQEEGSFTTRVKMVMYFVFLFRDPRYRSFICERIAIRDGLWDASAFRANSGPFFEGSGTTKAFTNLRQLLVQADLLHDRSFGTKPFPALSLWFPDAVETASAYITNAVAKQEFLSSPQSFLVKHGIHGLLNSTPAELNKIEVQITYEESADQLPIYAAQPARTASTSATALKAWAKTAPPKRSDLTPSEILNNPALLERANNQHFLLEKLVSDGCRAGGLHPQYNVHMDLIVETALGSILFEMKSCQIGSTRSQIRRAVSQVFEYSYIYRNRVKHTIQPCIVVERRPRGIDEWLIEYVEFLKVALVWKKDRSDELECSKRSLELLGPHITLLQQWIKASAL